ncbi:MAG: hypothetical protein KatS3mg035_0883 [Bacteroidia bacterium]|nr:MAG: hypothetical protein KatS3mg035_0883 [Bacteroidia bacterium]
MNNHLLILVFFPFLVFSQNFYIKPVLFFDYSILNPQNKFLFHVNEEELENFQFSVYQNDSLTSLRYPFWLSNQEVTDYEIIIQNLDNQTIAFQPLYFNPQFLISDSLQVYQQYLLHNKKIPN